MAIWKKKARTAPTMRDLLNDLQQNANRAHTVHDAAHKLLGETILEAQEAVKALNAATNNVLTAVGEAKLVKSNATHASITTSKELKLDGTDSQK